jgi:hypothetical protein
MRQAIAKLRLSGGTLAGQLRLVSEARIPPLVVTEGWNSRFRSEGSNRDITISRFELRSAFSKGD